MIIKKDKDKNKKRVALVVLISSGLWFLSIAVIQFLSDGLVKDVYYHALISSLMLYGASHVDQLFQPLGSYFESNEDRSAPASFYLFLAAIFLLYWLAHKSN